MQAAAVSDNQAGLDTAQATAASGVRRGPSWQRAEAIGLIGLLALGAILRLAFLLRAPLFITNDSSSYLLPGFDLATGQPFEPLFKRPPAYPAFVGLTLWFFGQQSLVGLLLVQHLLGLVTIGLTYALGRLLWGVAAARLAGLLAALSGPQIVTEHYLMSESVFGLALCGGVLAFVLALRRFGLRWIALAGVMLALAALTRPVAQLLLPPLALLLVNRRRCWRPALVGVGLLIGCYAIVVLPWMLRNTVVQHSFALAGGLGEGLAVRTIRLDQTFDFRVPGGEDSLRTERRIYGEEAAQGSAFELAKRLRTEAALSPAQADRAMREIALGAIAQKPWYYLSGSWDMFVRMFAGRPLRLRQDWQPWRGIQWEPRIAHLLPDATPLQESEFGQAQALVTLYDPARWPAALALLFLAGIAAGALSAQRTPRLLPALVAVALLFVSSYLVGIEWRYRYPLDPLIDVTVAGGAVAIGKRLASLGGRLRSRQMVGRQRS